MREIICAHRWSNFVEPYGYGTEPAPKSWAQCRWCDSVWYRDTPEPEIVIGKIRDGISNP